MAITLVGIRTIKNFALWSAVFSLMPNPKCDPFDLKLLWQDSLRRALFARRLGKTLGVKEAEELFAAALLQDMAVPLLAKELPDEYRSLLDARRGGEVRLSALEEEQFGWTHAEAGAVMARGWKLPEGFAVMIEEHTRVELSNAPDQLGKTVTALASMLPSTCDTEWSEQQPFSAAYCSLVQAASPTLTETFAAIDKDFLEFAPVLKLAVPSRALVDCLDEKA